MTIGPITFIVNAVLLLIAIVAGGLLLRLGALHSYNYGIAHIQEKLKWRILILILILIATSLFGAVYNLAVSVL